jgi:hypothetical protein
MVKYNITANDIVVGDLIKTGNNIILILSHEYIEFASVIFLYVFIDGLDNFYLHRFHCALAINMYKL